MIVLRKREFLCEVMCISAFQSTSRDSEAQVEEVEFRMRLLGVGSCKWLWQYCINFEVWER